MSLSGRTDWKDRPLIEMMLKVLQTVLFYVVHLSADFNYEINAASLVEGMNVLTSLFCSDAHTLPLYLHCSTSIARFEAALASRGVVCTQRSLKCSPASEVLC